MCPPGAAALAACGGVAALAALAESASAAACARPRDAAPLLRAAAGAVANAFGAADADARAALADAGGLRLLVHVAAAAGRAEGFAGGGDGGAAAGDALCHVARGFANFAAPPGGAPHGAAAMLVTSGGVAPLLAIVAAPWPGAPAGGRPGSAPVTPARCSSWPASPLPGASNAQAPAGEDSCSGGGGGADDASSVVSSSSAHCRVAPLPAGVAAPAAAKKHAAQALAALARDPSAARAAVAAGGLQALSMLAATAERDDVARAAQRALSLLQTAADGGDAPHPERTTSDPLSGGRSGASSSYDDIDDSLSALNLGTRGRPAALTVPDSPPRPTRHSTGAFSPLGPPSPGGGLSLGYNDLPRRPRARG
jgi:hypothetical protein